LFGVPLSRRRRDQDEPVTIKIISHFGGINEIIVNYLKLYVILEILRILKKEVK